MKERKEEKEKTKNKESLPDYDPGKRTANRSRQGRDTQFRSIDLSFMRGKAKRVREKELEEKNQSKDTRQQRTRGGLLCPHILSRGDETKGMTEENE